MPKRSPGPISHVTSSRILRPVTVIFCAAEVISSEDHQYYFLAIPEFLAIFSQLRATCAAATPASTESRISQIVDGNFTEPCTCGSAYMARTTSTRDADASMSATSGSISASPCTCSKICVTSIRSTTCLPRRDVAHLLQFQRIAHRRHVGDELTRGLHMEFLLGRNGRGHRG